MLDEERAELIKKHASLKIDRLKKIDYPPVALSIGEATLGQNVYPIPFGTYGNFSALVAPPKAGKSYFTSLLKAAYIGGNSNAYAPNIKTHREGELFILDFNTEEGLWHASMGAKRVDQIVGNHYENYMPFMLRELDAMERVEFIEYEMYHKFRGKTGIVVIDGIADLITDVNSLEESNEMTQKLMRWTSELKIHIIVVIHTTFGNTKATGHLGSAITKKAETVCLLEREGDLTKVSFPFCRGFKIDDFNFRLDNDGLPVIEEAPY
jgi:hypothetical protein